MLVTSVVMRVTRPAVEYLSMLAKLKVWMLRNMPRRRLRAKPVAAWEPATAPRMPNSRPNSAATTICAPTV